VTGAFLDIVIDPILLGFMAPRGGQKALTAAGAVRRRSAAAASARHTGNVRQKLPDSAKWGYSSTPKSRKL
jgi:hypothetical protein